MFFGRWCINIKIKSILYMIILLITATIISSCSNDINPSKLAIYENSISKIIKSKDENHDFLKDKEYTDLMEKLIAKFSKKENINPEHIVIGNLSSNS